MRAAGKRRLHSPRAPEYKDAEMNANLRDSVMRLATHFAEELLQLVWSGLSEELEAGGRSAAPVGDGGRRARRSEADVRADGDRILAVLGKAPAGLRAEDLRAKLGMSRPAIGRPLKLLIAAGRVRKTGEKRATVYSLGAPAAKPKAKPAKKAAA